jgi:hypothetical protein
MNLHRKNIQDCGENWIAREPKATSEEVAKYDNFSVFGSRGLLIVDGENPST